MIGKKGKNQKPASNYLDCVLVIGGIDPTSGAGIFTDNKVFNHFKFWPLNVITLLAIQNSVDGVTKITPTSIEDFKAQLDAIFNEFKDQIKVVKIGMIADAKQANMIGEYLDKYLNNQVQVIVDPVLVCKNKYVHQNQEEMIEAYNNLLLKSATIITPNMTELILLTQSVNKNLKNTPSTAFADDTSIKLDELQKNCIILSSHTNTPHILCKFKNLITIDKHGNEVVIEIGEIFCTNNQFYIFEHEKQDKVFHGSGCNLASVLACRSIQSNTGLDAAKSSVYFIQNQLANAKKVYHNIDTLTLNFDNVNTSNNY